MVQRRQSAPLLHALDREAMVQNFSREKRLSRMCRFRECARATRKPGDRDPVQIRPGDGQKLLAEAGWKPGSDCVLVNSKGERMEFEFRVTAERRDHEQAQAIIADYWKKVGVRTNIKNLPNRLLNCGKPQPLARRFRRNPQCYSRRMARAVPHQEHSISGEQVRARKRLRLE